MGTHLICPLMGVAMGLTSSPQVILGLKQALGKLVLYSSYLYLKTKEDNFFIVFFFFFYMACIFLSLNLKIMIYFAAVLLNLYFYI